MVNDHIKNIKQTHFYDFFSTFYGDSWSQILIHLIQKKMPFKRKNTFHSNTYEHLALEYSMDFASYESIQSFSRLTQSLHFIPQKILDMCSAPGGKALCLMDAYSPQECHYTLNEISSSRKLKLSRVLKEYLPENIYHHIKLSGKNGGLLGNRLPNTFDFTLADVPCSSERHHLHKQDWKWFQDWTPKKSQRMGKRQLGLLNSALLATKKGGYILYSTCSLSPFENDCVIDQLINKAKKRNMALEITALKDPKFFHQTSHGYMALPSEEANIGPLYCCLIHKLL